MADAGATEDAAGSRTAGSTSADDARAEPAKLGAAAWLPWARVAGALLCVAPALWQLSLELRLFVSRVRYPADVEWLEGPALYQAWRMLHGQSTYAPPSQGYLPLFHPPGYPAALAAAGSIFGLDYGVARTVSFSFFLVATLLVARETWRHAEEPLTRRVTSLLTAGFVAAAVPLFQSFYDLVRADVMALCLSALAAVLVLEPRPSSRRIACLAAVQTAIVYTRLPAVFFPIWITAFALWRNRKAGAWLALGTASACGIVLVALQYVSRGWFWMMTVASLQDHLLFGANVRKGATMVMTFAPYIGPAYLVAGGLALRDRLSPRTTLWLGMLTASIPAALLPFGKAGGFANDLMPIGFFSGVAAMFVALDLVRALAERPRAREATRAVVLAAAAGYLAVRTYDLTPFTPTERHWRKARAFSETLAGLEGNVLIPRAPFVAIRNGKGADQFSDMPYLDAFWSGMVGLDLGGYIDRSKADWAIVTGTEVPYTAGEIADRFELERVLADPPVTLLGEINSPRFVLHRIGPRGDGRVVFDFERGTLDGWELEGTAFAIGNPAPPNQTPIRGSIGRHLLTSYNPKQRDAAVGRATSPPFVLDRPRLSLRLGAGGGRKTARAELHVGERVVAQGTAVFGVTETLLKMVWDVSRFEGEEARLVLVDEDKAVWGHLLCDDVLLYSPAAGSPEDTRGRDRSPARGTPAAR